MISLSACLYLLEKNNTCKISDKSQQLKELQDS